MNAKTWVPLALAIICAIAAALVARQVMLSRPAAAANPEAALRTVVVANGNILPGTEITADLLLIAKVSPEMAQDTFASAGELVGRVAQAPIYKGQPVIGKLLAPKGSPSGLAGLVPPGMRAIAIEVNEFSGVAGFLTPGCRVDVLATLQGDRNGELVSRTVVQNVMVTAIGQRMSVQRESGRDEQPFRSVTIIATPEEAKAIELAAATGRPRLVLRNQGDHSRDTGSGVSLSDIRDGAGRNVLAASATGLGGVLGGLLSEAAQRRAMTVAAAPVEGAATPVEATPSAVDPGFWTIRVIRGGASSEVRFPFQVVPQTSKPAPAPARPAGLGGESITEAGAGDANGK